MGRPDGTGEQGSQRWLAKEDANRERKKEGEPEEERGDF